MVLSNLEEEKRKLRVLVAGGGIGGLVLALAAKHRGYEVKVFEKDLSAVRGEGRHRGPIQLLSGALAVLETIDQSVARQIMEAGCVTANRTNGLADGLSGDWYVILMLFFFLSLIGILCLKQNKKLQKDKKNGIYYILHNIGQNLDIVL